MKHIFTQTSVYNKVGVNDRVSSTGRVSAAECASGVSNVNF